MDTKEIWKPVVGYEDSYEVSNLGNVRSLDRQTVCSDGSHRLFKGKNLNKCKRNGYPFVNLRRDLHTKSLYVHNLVAVAFIPNPMGLPQIDHINTIREDNRVENLRWVTRSENMNNPITRKKILKNCYNSEECRGKIRKTREERGLNKKVYTYRRDGKFDKEYESASFLAKELGVPSGHINDGCRCGFAVRGVFCSYEKKERIEHKYSNKYKR